MKRFLTLCLASLLTVHAHAARRVGDADVRSGKNELPCFTIAEHEERLGGSPDFQVVTVSSGRRVLWRMAMPGERTFPLASSMCIPYGGRVQALPQTPAAPLERGIVYSVELEPRPGKYATALVYKARFCLTRGRDGRPEVRRINPGDHQGRDLYGCLD